MTDLEGTYLVAGIDVPYKASITLSSIMGLPAVDFVEQIEGRFNCKGLYSVSFGTEVNFTMYCGDITFQEAYQKMMNNIKPDFTQSIDLEKVTPKEVQSSFIAPVKSSLYDNVELRFKFTRNTD